MNISTKTIKAVNSMVRHPELISGAFDKNGTYYFTYDGKHKFSVGCCRDWDPVEETEWDRYDLYYYPDSRDLEAIAQGLTHGPSVRFSSDTLEGKEGFDSLRELYQLLAVKVHGVEKVMDEITQTDTPF